LGDDITSIFKVEQVGYEIKIMSYIMDEYYGIQQMETRVLKTGFFKREKKLIKGRKKIENRGMKIITLLQSPLMSSESHFLTLLKT
jgi:hypothetical protein